MFRKGGYVLYGIVGVCQVEGILKPDFFDNDRVCYSFVPKFNQDAIIYVPMDSPKAKMREIMTRQEAKQFILALPSIEGKQYANDKERPQTYRQVLEPGDYTRLASMIKEISETEQNRRGKGKSLFIHERNDVRNTRKLLLEEPTTALDIYPEEIPDYVTSQIDEV